MSRMRCSQLSVTAVALCCTLGFAHSTFASVLVEDWEGGWGLWYADNGIWEVGDPTSGPGAAHQGTNVAATILGGNYPVATTSSLTSPPIVFPPSPEDNTLTLAFWHWFNVYGGDNARVEIKALAAPTWDVLSQDFTSGSGFWTRRNIDISSYAGQTVQIRFYFSDDGARSGSYPYPYYVTSGWYLDELQITEGLPAPWTEEGFEYGLGGWYATHGVWETGIPSSGPGSAHSGFSCAATGLAGDYPVGTESRLVSQQLQLPVSPADGKLELSFWHWFSTYGGDVARVEIQTSTVDWTPITEVFAGNSGAWTRYAVDISTYAGQGVRLALYFDDDGARSGSYPYPYYVASGWFVDEIKISEGAPAAWTREGFESGIGDWYASHGVWEVGNPSSGPGSAKIGQGVAATNLRTSYPVGTASRLVSPPMALSSAPADGELWLSFWHWFSTYGGDTAQVEIKTTAVDWTPITANFAGSSGAWSRHLVDLSSYAGQSVQFALYFDDDGARSGSYPYPYYVSSGWYVDEFEVLEGKRSMRSPEYFESKAWAFAPDMEGWHADYGVWEIGEPTAGPGAAYSGKYVAATVLGGNYPVGTSSRLVSPAVTLPASPGGGQLWLSFAYWLSKYNPDTTEVQIRDSGGVWSPLMDALRTSSGGWIRSLVDLTPYLGQTVEFGFLFADDGARSGSYPYPYYISSGWYLDDLAIVEGELPQTNPESFESRTNGWAADQGLWQVGAPTGGAAPAPSGNWAAGTGMASNYFADCDSRFVSPSMTVPAGGYLRFNHWFSVCAGDSATVEVSVSRGPWQQVGGPFTGSSGAWTPYIVADLTAYYGQEVRFGLRLKDNGDGCVSNGWYVDEFQLIGAPTGAPSAPEFIQIDYTSGPPLLSWTEPAGGYEWIAIYGGLEEGFEPSISNRIALVQGNTFSDVAHPGWNLHYKISAIGANGGESSIVGPGLVTDTGPPSAAAQFALEQNRPNPFNPATVISFALPAEQAVKIELFNAAGRRVATLLNETRPAGPNQVRVDGRGLASGVYFYRMTAGGFVESKRMTLLK